MVWKITIGGLQERNGEDNINGFNDAANGLVQQLR